MLTDLEPLPLDPTVEQIAQRKQQLEHLEELGRLFLGRVELEWSHLKRVCKHEDSWSGVSMCEPCGGCHTCGYSW